MYDFVFNCPSCKEVAFEYKEMPKMGETLESKKAFYPQKGIRPNNSEKVICDNCEMEIPIGYLVSVRVSKK